MTTVLADLHLAPTASNRFNLLREGIADDRVIITGNTVVDALFAALRAPLATACPDVREVLNASAPVLLVTSHRRESWGDEMAEIARALGVIAATHTDWLIVFPLHKNPVVRQAFRPTLARYPNVRLLEPVPYVSFTHLMRRARILLTDSGGIQEEAPSLDRPVLVMRNTTERPEAVSTGATRLVGTEQESIVGAVGELIRNKNAYERMARSPNPYGDGLAARRILDALLWRYRDGERPLEFDFDSEVVCA
jgi:UDP-N-acetylglucosamine 2-epimerase (non-hydrolysing)